MNPGRTLADRFRAQRTDRIRVDEQEVISMVEITVSEPLVIEVVVEQRRDDHQVLIVSTSLEATLGHADGGTLGTEARLDIDVESPVELVVLPADGPLVVRLWNAWDLVGVEHAWTGNSGCIREDLPIPDGALGRFRLWCSDGLGEPSFDDLVVVVTTAQLEDAVAGERREAHLLDLAASMLWEEE